jgi:hypothetical protein
VPNLHDNIMRLVCEPDSDLHGERLAFKRGHKQARHGAAELAAAYVQHRGCYGSNCCAAPDGSGDGGDQAAWEWSRGPKARAGHVSGMAWVADQSGSELDVEVDGRRERWLWTFEGVSCTVVSLPA